MNESSTSEFRENNEGILTREEIIAAIGRHVEKYTIERELSDADGIYLFEVTTPGENPGEKTEYTYQRKGAFGQNVSTTTTISVAFYEDEMPVGGNTLANYDEQTGEWN